MNRPGLVPQVAPCIVSHNMALGGAQTAILRLIHALPQWVRERTTLYCQSDDMPLLQAAIDKHGFTVGAITTEAPADPSCWVLSYGNLRGLPERPTSLILHSWDDEGWRYISKTYGHLRGLTIAAVSQQVLNRYSKWIADGGHAVAGLLPPPVTQWCIARGARDADGIVVAWMGRPLESKGLLTLPYLLALDRRLVVRAWTGAETAGLDYTRKVQSQTLEKMLALADELGVRDRLDLRALDFDPFAYRHRLEGCHVLLGNSRQEGFLLTAAEAMSCGIPAVVTRSCGVADFIAEGVNGRLIDWDEDPRRLARASYEAIIKTADIDSLACLRSVRELSLAASYTATHQQTLAQVTHTALAGPSPRVTVAVRIHQGMLIASLDEAISSLALQTYRRFKTVLLVDGTWEFGQSLAQRYGLPLRCTGVAPDITHCSWLHRQAVAACDTEFYKPLDYDDQLLPHYLQTAVAAMDQRHLDVYGCRLMTLEAGQLSERKWPHKPLETMFTGNSDDNMLPHSSVLMRTEICRKAGNYQDRAVGLGADDYSLWFRIHQAGGVFYRDDARNVVYRIHEKNSLKIRRARYGAGPAGARAAVTGPSSDARAQSAWVAPLNAANAVQSHPPAGDGKAPPLAPAGAIHRGKRLAGAAAAAAAIALSAGPAAASTPPADGTSLTKPRPDQTEEPAGNLLDRMIANVRRAGKFAASQLAMALPPSGAAPPDGRHKDGHGPDLAPPHS